MVEDSEEGLTPTVGGEYRRRIRLVARGVTRFEIMQVLHNGFGGGRDAGYASSPFIVAECKLLLLDISLDVEGEKKLSELRTRAVKEFPVGEPNASSNNSQLACLTVKLLGH